MVDRDWLREADRLRSDDPEGALRRLHGRVAEIPKELAAFYLAVCGSTYRNLAGRSSKIESLLDKAEEMFRHGLWHARRANDGSQVADLLIRSSYVAAERILYGKALSLSEQALAASERAHDPETAGKAFVEQGRYLYYLNRYDESIKALNLAREKLPESNKANRFAALQVLGLCYLGLEKLAEAYQFSTQAEGLAPNQWQQGKLQWLQARICLQIPELKSAEQHLISVVDTFRGLHLGETSLAACELVRSQMLLGRHQEAWETAVSVKELIIPLGDNRTVAGALMELIRGGQAALSLARVEKVLARINRARESTEWPSLALAPASR